METPPGLPNTGNSCFLASMTQLLICASRRTGGALFSSEHSSAPSQPSSQLLQTLYQLCTSPKSRVSSVWSSQFVPSVFKCCPQLKSGRQDDSGKAFSALMGVVLSELRCPDWFTISLKLKKKSPGCLICATEEWESVKMTCMVFAGADGEDDSFSDELLGDMRDTVSNSCPCCSNQEQTLQTLFCLPSLLFVVGSATSASILKNIFKSGLVLPSAEGKDFKYRMIGASVHTGSQESGHYTALVNPNGTWYSCNDGVISVMPASGGVPSSLPSTDAHLQLLLFERLDS